MSIERRIGAPEHEAAPAAIDAEEIPLAPHAGIFIEIRFAVTLVVVVAPEKYGHRRHGLRDDKLADLVHHALATIVEGIGVDAEQPALHLAGIYRQYGHTADER